MIERAVNVACRHALAIEIMTQGQERRSLMLARLHHGAAVAFYHHRAAARWRPGRGRSHRQDRKRDFDRAGFVKLQRRLGCLPASSGCLSFMSMR